MPATTAHSEQPVIVLAGATATGKSDLAVDIAEEFGGEIINADAMQLYRGMDIGTAKITVPERRGIPHHLLDVLDISEDASVSAYQAAARASVADIHERGLIPVITGGSGLYIRALIDQIEFPGTDHQIRSELESIAAEKGNGYLQQELLQVDPESANKIQVGDTRRLVRALEVYKLTGKPFTAFMPKPVYHYGNVINLALARERGELHQRVELRVDKMLEQGLVAETEQLMKQGLAKAPTAGKAIGYAETIAYLKGQLNESCMREKIIIGTRRLVRKQDTWFKKDNRIKWIDVAPGKPARLADLGSVKEYLGCKLAEE